MKRSYKSASIGELTPQLNDTTKKEYKAFYVEKKESTDNLYPRVKAALPEIKDQALKLSMSNFNQYAARYNLLIKEENKEIKAYNKKVKIWLEKNELGKGALKRKKTLLNIAKNTARRRKYNEIVDKTHLFFGHPVTEKLQILPIRDCMEKTFRAILYAYNKKLARISNLRRKTNRLTYAPVPKVEFNTSTLLALQDKGLPMLSCRKQALLDRKIRLIEAGVLKGEEYRGSKKGTLHHINNQILTVFCHNEKKYLNIDYQAVTPEEARKAYDNNILTIKIDKNINKEEIRSSHSLTTSNFSTGSPTSKVEEKNQAGENKPAIFNENSEKLRGFLYSPEELGRKLAAGDYFENGAPFTREELKQEMKKGYLSRTEFKMLCISFHFMQYSKVWKERPAYAGSWTNAIYNWIDHKFITNNKQLQDKHGMLSMLFKYQDVYFRAIKFHKEKPDFKFLFPSLYFEHNSKNPYSFNIYGKKQNELMKKESAEKSSYKKSNTKKANKKRIEAGKKPQSQLEKDMIKLRRKVHLYCNNHIELEEVLIWALHNTEKQLYRMIDFHIKAIIEDWNTNNQLVKHRSAA